jgi:hypothetical protein
MDRLTSRELQVLLATLRTYALRTLTAFASAPVRALPRLIAVGHVVWRSLARYLGAYCRAVLRAGARSADLFDRRLRRQQQAGIWGYGRGGGRFP